jgi:opacity protein-like surface antigen
MTKHNRLGMAVAALTLLCAPLAHAADVVPTPSSVAKSAGATVSEGVAGASITAGQVVYIDTAANNVLKLADCNGSATTAAVAGIALHAAATGQPLRYAIKDPNFTPGFTVGVGRVYTTSQTPGGIAPNADNEPSATPGATGCFTTVIGIGKTASTMFLQPMSAGVAIP